METSPTTPPCLAAAGTSSFTASAVAELEVSPPLRCASLLKPLYAWAADVPGWEELSEAMVVHSDNAATTELVGRAGGLALLLEVLHERTGVHWRPAPTWGQVEVTSPEVARAYRYLMADPGARAQSVLRWMREVPTPQQLGIPPSWSALTGQPLSSLGVKCGWDLDEVGLRTHAVVLGPEMSAVVLTRVAVDGAARQRWERLLREGGPTAVLPLHLQWAGPALSQGLALAAVPDWTAAQVVSRR